MLGDISFGANDLARAVEFYDATMTALGYARVFSGPRYVGYGLAGTDQDKLLLILKFEGTSAPGPGFDLAFIAGSREAIDRFYTAALKNGGTDNGAPGLRPNYRPDYYAAFVVDPEGIRLEAVYQS